MSDKKLLSNPEDESGSQNSPIEAGQESVSGKRKNKRLRKNSLLPSSKNQDQNEPALPQAEEQDSANVDDHLADIRRSLIEEETSKQEKKKSGVFQRVVRFIHPDKSSATAEDMQSGEIETILPVVEDVPESIADIIALPSGDENVLVAETAKRSEPEAGGEIVLSGTVAQDDADVIPSLATGESIPHKSLAGLLPQQPSLGETLRTQPEKEEVEKSFESIREVVLEDYDNSPFTEQNNPVVPLRQKLRVLRRKLKPLDIVVTIGALSLICVAAMVGFGFKIISAQVADETPVPTPELPVPVRMTLPGGWAFKLAKGKVENDKWSPKGPEWLEGTELCKWVALPWSVQLEAVVRTLKSNDPIELTMSNADPLKFKVYSIQNVPVDQIDTLGGKTTCLLIILVNPNSDTRWVVTAIP